jgi:hypothetical protein
MIRYCAVAGVLGCIAALGIVAALSKEGTGPVGEADGKVLFSEDFSKGMGNWWIEGGVKTWVEDGRLHMNAEPGGERRDQRQGYVCTAWCRQEFSGDVKVELDAHVRRSDLDVNNINLFLHFSDPSGKPLYETRESRADAAYNKYHGLNGNIITYLKDTSQEAVDGKLDRARVRIRHCPGFELLKETYTYHCRQGRTYRVELLKRGGRLTIAVDGNELLTAEDPEPLDGGLLGLRTYRTYLWWDNIRVTQLSGE